LRIGPNGVGECNRDIMPNDVVPKVVTPRNEPRQMPPVLTFFACCLFIGELSFKDSEGNNYAEEEYQRRPDFRYRTVRVQRIGVR
jgi:hypothetical protein